MCTEVDADLLLKLSMSCCSTSTSHSSIPVASASAAPAHTVYASTRSACIRSMLRSTCMPAVYTVLYTGHQEFSNTSSFRKPCVLNFNANPSASWPHLAHCSCSTDQSAVLLASSCRKAETLCMAKTRHTCLPQSAVSRTSHLYWYDIHQCLMLCSCRKDKPESDPRLEESDFDKETARLTLRMLTARAAGIVLQNVAEVDTFKAQWLQEHFKKARQW